MKTNNKLIPNTNITLKQFTELSKYIEKLYDEYDMTEAQYDLWDDIMEKIKELKKSASKTK
jgi:hypothetical protein